MTEIENWCLGTWEKATDYILMEWDINKLPTLYEQDLKRYEYKQNKYERGAKSCTIFSAISAVSDLFNYEFSYDEIKEIDDQSYAKNRIKWQWWYTQSAVDLVAKRWNEHHSDLGKVAYYRVDMNDDASIEKILEKNYDICTGFYWNAKYKSDYSEDGVLNWTEFGASTYWHAVPLIWYAGKRFVKDNYKGRKYNIYEIEHKMSEITCYHNYWYVYTKVAEDNLEEIKRLNEIKSKCNLLIDELWNLWHLVNDTNFQAILHYTADKLRAKIQTCTDMLDNLQ